MNLLLEDTECRGLQGGRIERTEYMALVNAHRRCLENLGLLNGSDTDFTPPTQEDAKALAKSVVDVLRENGGADVAQLIGGLDSDAPAEHAAAALETEGDALTPNSGCAAPSFSASRENSDPADFSPPPESVDSEIFPNGSRVVRVEITGSRQVKFAVIDARDHVHGYRRNRADAVAFAESLPDSFPVQPEPEKEEASR